MEIIDLAHKEEQGAGYSLSFLMIETPLGQMIAVSDEKSVCLLQFYEEHSTERSLKKLSLSMQASINKGSFQPLISVQKEIEQYFEGNLKEFKTPLNVWGTPFQQKVWDALGNIPYGSTQSYTDQAIAIQAPTAHRAVANANGANPLVIVIPCHRVTQKNGNLGGYAGGIDRKKWLLAHEQAHRI